jgi:RHS repeat-associated protein
VALDACPPAPCGRPLRVGAWRSLVAHTLGVRVVAGSNPAAPTKPPACFNYDNASRRTTLTLPNGVTVAYTYDNESRVSGITYTAGSTQLGNLTYSYDADGRRTATAGSLAATGMPATVSGNTFNADNSMTGFNGTALGYDAAGQLTADGTNTYTWDARHHLTAISGGATASFVYDAFGRRASKTINGVTTQFLYDGLNPVQELNGANPPADALGSTVGLVNSAGGIDTSYTEPFGKTTISGSNGNPYQFTGRENDGTGLYFYRTRYYSPSYQRLVSQDPIGFAGGDANLYGYVWNDPADFVDPPGLWGVGGTIGGEGGTGLGSVAVGGTGSLGGGYFSSGGWGGFATGGGFGFGLNGQSLSPPCPGGSASGFGGYAGGGANLFITNADNVSQLAGPFRTYSFNLGLGVRLSFSTRWGKTRLATRYAS